MSCLVQEGIVRVKLTKVLAGYDDVHYERSVATGENIKAVCNWHFLDIIPCLDSMIGIIVCKTWSCKYSSIHLFPQKCSLTLHFNHTNSHN